MTPLDALRNRLDTLKTINPVAFCTPEMEAARAAMLAEAERLAEEERKRMWHDYLARSTPPVYSGINILGELPVHPDGQQGKPRNPLHTCYVRIIVGLGLAPDENFEAGFDAEYIPLMSDLDDYGLELMEVADLQPNNQFPPIEFVICCAPKEAAYLKLRYSVVFIQPT